jgi:hypothetical protein
MLPKKLCGSIWVFPEALSLLTAKNQKIANA